MLSPQPFPCSFQPKLGSARGDQALAHAGGRMEGPRQAPSYTGVSRVFLAKPPRSRRRWCRHISHLPARRLTALQPHPWATQVSVSTSLSERDLDFLPTRSQIKPRGGISLYTWPGTLGFGSMCCFRLPDVQTGLKSRANLQLQHWELLSRQVTPVPWAPRSNICSGFLSLRASTTGGLPLLLLIISVASPNYSLALIKSKIPGGSGQD